MKVVQNFLINWSFAETFMIKKIGIGCDIIEIQGFKGSRGVVLKKFAKIFTLSEFEYCFTKSFPEQHLAARFSAKEALIKAFSALSIKVLDYHDVEILNRKGLPYVAVRNIGKGCKISLSLSHCKRYAMAYAHITK